MSETVRSLRAIALPAYGPTALGSIGTGAVLPVVVLSARALGAEVSVAAFLMALIWLAQLAGDLPAGALAARIGERRALVVACGVEAVGMAGAATARHLAVLAGSLCLLGLSGSLFGLARQAYLTEAVPVHLRARALSTLGGVHRVGLFLGPFAGAAAVARWGVTAAYVVGFVSSVAALGCVLAVRDITREITGDSSHDITGDSSHDISRGSSRANARASSVPPRRSVAQVLGEHRRTLLTLGVGVLFIAAARACRVTLVPLVAESIGLDAARTSLVVGIAGAVDMLLFYPAGGVMDRFGRTWVAVPSMLVLGTGMATLPLAHSFGTLTAAAVVLGFGNGIGSGLVMTLGADAAPADARVQFLGGWRLMADLGNAAGPALVSAITVAFPLAVAALAMAAVSLLGAAWLRTWVPRVDPVARARLQRRGASS